MTTWPVAVNQMLLQTLTLASGVFAALKHEIIENGVYCFMTAGQLQQGRCRASLVLFLCYLFDHEASMILSNPSMVRVPVSVSYNPYKVVESWDQRTEHNAICCRLVVTQHQTLVIRAVIQVLPTQKH